MPATIPAGTPTVTYKVQAVRSTAVGTAAQFVVNFGVAGGDIRSTIRMDAREKTIRTRADITAKGLNLGELFPGAKLTDDAIGRIGGRVAITGTGNSIARMLGAEEAGADAERSKMLLLESIYYVCSYVVVVEVAEGVTASVKTMVVERT